MKYLLLMSSLFATLSLNLAVNPKVTEKVTLDIQIEGEEVGKIEIGLFGKTVQKTVKSFVDLCKRPFGLGYKGSKFHLIGQKYVETGSFKDENGNRGKTIYGDYYRRENFRLGHYGAGWVSMSLHGADPITQECSSEFFITLEKIPAFDGRNVVFGKVLKGMDVVRTIGGTTTDKTSKPIKEILIADCTVEEVKKPFAVKKTDATE